MSLYVLGTDTLTHATNATSGACPASPSKTGVSDQEHKNPRAPPVGLVISLRPR
jgi:hypothetical protein